MPTGVHLRDPREQLFGAAEHLLLREGPDALTSRAVTVRAGCAKGVLHRHFESFDAFLAEFVLDRIDRMRPQGAALREAAGTRTVVDNVTDAVMRLFGPLAVSIVALVTFQNEVRVRLREARPAGGVPVLAEIVGILTAYLEAERERGRVAADADVAVLVPTLVGALHLRFADSDDTPPGAEDVRGIVATVLAGAVAPG
ncbi:TetR/AcrR family transcriptional regulator [Streptomyces sp. NPDC090994]|uniref:TetR/AcrR family transcriptional regulator n=1 Tax=Streptomyces sp. NPDC090994 TaxID=3365969 RepID=UPI00382F86AE